MSKNVDRARAVGLPIEMDGASLTDYQARVLFGIYRKLVVEAEHPQHVAVAKAIEVFREMYGKSGDKWQPKRVLILKNHAGAIVRNRHFGAERRKKVMGRVRAEVAREKKRIKDSFEKIVEAGARNSRGDKERIGSAIGAMFNVLTKKDQQKVLKKLGDKLGKRIRFAAED